MSRLVVLGRPPGDPLVDAMLAASTSFAGWTAAPEPAPEFTQAIEPADVVLLDCTRLDGGAITLVEELAASAAQPIVLAFGCAPEDADALRAAGADQALTGPAPAPGLLVCVADLLIAQRKLKDSHARAAAAQARCEQRFREIFERNADGFVVVDGVGEIRFLNPAAAALLGRSREALLGESFGFPLVAGETTELEMVRPDRAHRIVEMRVVESEWDGAPARLASLRDMTERRKAEEQELRLAEESAARTAAEASERRARVLAAASRVLTESFDSDLSLSRLAEIAVSDFCDWCVIDLVREPGQIERHSVTHANPDHAYIAAELRTLTPSAEAVRGPANTIRSGRAELINGLDDDALRQIAPDPDRYRILREMDVSSMIFAPLEARGRVLGAVTFIRTADVFEDSDLDCAEELAQRVALALDNARLFETSLMASQAKSDFLATISHELRTPLNAIMGYADLLQNGIVQPTPEALNDYLGRVIRSAQSLHDMIEDILSFERTGHNREQLQIEVVSLPDLLEHIRGSVADHAAAKGLPIRVMAADGPKSIATDVAKLSQILKHLLRNAIKFTEHGEVRVETSTSRDHVCIEVSDTGIGIATQHLERIFDPFWQVERALTRRAGGAGLGLSLARRYAHLLGGDIRVRTEPGKGSTFTVRLPHPQEPAPAKPSRDA